MAPRIGRSVAIGHAARRVLRKEIVEAGERLFEQVRDRAIPDKENRTGSLQTRLSADIL
jgi:hypothetical protein